MTATWAQAELIAPASPAETGGAYFGWHDPDRKKATAHKVREAAMAFRARFGCDPVRVLTSCVDLTEPTEIDGMTVTPQTFVSAGTFYLSSEAA